MVARRAAQERKKESDNEKRNTALAAFLGLVGFAMFPNAAFAASCSMYSLNKGEAHLYDQDSIESNGQSVQVWSRLVMGNKSFEEIAIA
jgi:hypothetical protein